MRLGLNEILGLIGDLGAGRGLNWFGLGVVTAPILALTKDTTAIPIYLK